MRRARRYTRAYLAALFKGKNTLGPQLLTFHNISYMMRFTAEMREAIVAQRWARLGTGV